MRFVRPRAFTAGRSTWLVAALLGLAVFLPVSATGEDVLDEEGDGLETLFVTAERRVADLQETGGSVALFTESMLEDRNIYNVKDVTEYVPNVKMHTNVGGNTGFAVNIRGAIKGDPIISREPAVGIYVDEVYLANMVGVLFDVLDLEAIEVLRGPQGTLYGRNTNGGAIKLRTRAPDDRVSLRNDFTYGNFNTLNNRTVLNLPLLGGGGDALVDAGHLGSLNTRTAFAYLSRDGYIDAVSNGLVAPPAAPHTVGANRLDDANRWAVHHRTLWEPVDWLSIDYIFDKTHVREEPTAVHMSFIDPNPLSLGALLTPLLGGQVRNERVDEIAQDTGPGGIPLRSSLDVWGHAVTPTVTLPPLPVLGDVTFKSITAYREKRNQDISDIDGTGFSVLQSRLDIKHEQLSQELQLLGSTAEGRVDYVAGFYFFDEKGKADNTQAFYQDPVFAPIPFPAPPDDPRLVADFYHKAEKRSWAGFAQADYTPPILDDRLTLTGGLRYTRETVGIDVLNSTTFNVVGVPQVVIDTGIGGSAFPFLVPRPKDTFDDVSWLARAKLDVTDDIMTYFKVTTGFLSGGFNARNTNNPNFGPTPNPFGVPYDPETLLSYELGVRSDLLERRVRFNGTFFYYDYEDIQVSLFDPGVGSGASTIVKNAAAASIWGFELELLAQVYEGVELNLAYGYTKAEYENFIDEDDFGVVRDVSDERGFAQTPEHSLVVGASYRLPAFSWGTVLGRMDWTWNSAVQFSERKRPEIDEDSSWLLNGMIQVADLALPADAGTGRIQFWVRNITDENFKEFGFSLGPIGYAVNTFTDPRTYGLTFVWEWER